MGHAIVEHFGHVLDGVERVGGNVVDFRTKLGQLIKSLKLLGGREHSLVFAGQVEVVEKSEDEVGDVVDEAGIRTRGQDGSAANVVQVQVGDVHDWRQLVGIFYLSILQSLSYSRFIQYHVDV